METRSARVGDLVVTRVGWRWPTRAREEAVGQVVRQTDIMSEVITAEGTVLVRTCSIEVVQPGGLGHTLGRR